MKRYTALVSNSFLIVLLFLAHSLNRIQASEPYRALDKYLEAKKVFAKSAFDKKYHKDLGDLNRIGVEGITVLQSAIGRSSTGSCDDAFIAFLLQRGADPLQKGSNGQDAIDLCIKQFNIVPLRVFSDHKIIVPRESHYVVKLITLVNKAIGRSSSDNRYVYASQCASLLITMGCSADIPDNDGIRPLVLSIDYYDTGGHVLETFLEHNADAFHNSNELRALDKAFTTYDYYSKAPTLEWAERIKKNFERIEENFFTYSIKIQNYILALCLLTS